MKRIVFLIIILISNNLSAQFSVGAGGFYRLADDIPGNAPGIKLTADFYETGTDGLRPVYFNCSIAYSTFRPRRGTVTMDAYDSLQQPQQITVSATQQPHDFIASFGAGFMINPNHKKSYPYLTIGLSGIFRSIEVVYLESFDRNLYDEGFRTRNPYIPGALQLGFRIGGGVHFNFKRLTFQPNFSFGFGSTDARNKHPWNKYPNHIDIGMNLLFYSALR